MKEILKFWFEELKPEQWWAKDEHMDQEISHRFKNLHEQASRGELYLWRTSPEGRLAEIIVLDQFSRNIFRNDPKSFSQDGIALTLSQEGVALGADKKLTSVQRQFFYMPYMHSESLKIHEVAVQLFEDLGIKNNLDFELAHQKIIKKFGRYPHRNKILGRTSTQEEIAFLKTPNSSF